MLLAMKNEAESNLSNEENDFMLETSYGEDLEELTAAVMLMARLQPADDNAKIVPSYNAKAVIHVHASFKIHEQNGKSDRKCFRCCNPNHLIGECSQPPKDKNQRAFVGGSWSDNGEEDDEKAKDEACLVVQASSEICLGVDLEPDE
ncbi:hypothetical protein Tco_1538448 [Tanacetum coccineum]